MIFFLRKFKPDKKIEFIDSIRVIRSSRRKKTITLRIYKGRKEVLCPKNISISFLKSLIKSKKRWIEKKIEVQENLNKKAFELNEKYLLYKGKKFRLLKSENTFNKVSVKKGLMFIPKEISQEQKIFFIRDELKKKSYSYLKKRIEMISKKIKIKFKTIKIKNYSSIWGCCSSSEEISLNWKLIMLPPGIINYVIIHELCHILEPNHSKMFWNLVERYEPAFREKKKWLKKNGSHIIQY